MTVITSPLSIVDPAPGERIELAERLESVARDLRRLAEADPVLLATTVELSDWFLSAGEVLCLCGIAHDHLERGTKLLRTSQVYYINTEAGLARTLSRWYRLRTPMETPSSFHKH